MICDVCHHPIDGCDRVFRSPTGRLSHFDCNATRTTMRTGLVQALYGDPPSDQPSPTAAPPAPVKSEDSQVTSTPSTASTIPCSQCGKPMVNYGVDWLCSDDACTNNTWAQMAKAAREAREAGQPTPVKSEAAKLIDSHMDLCQRARDIMVGKNHDYRGGSGDPFANFRGSTAFGIDPIVGILLRMQDKMSRIRTFTEKGTLAVKSESVEDSVIDIINYAVLVHGMCVERKHGESCQHA